jgi:dolichol-phosphate mannosyltransferase
MKILVFIPTYNEKDNAPKLCRELLDIGLPIDILFCDDNSPDKTGILLDEIAVKNPSVKIMHRTGKQGIGSAHYAGIEYGYTHGYNLLITMDADFTHKPEYVKRMIKEAGKGDLIVASRYMSDGSLPGWNKMRKCLTHTGHLLTKMLLGMDYDATGALRLYNLNKIPFEVFNLVSSKGYSFFFESLYILHLNGFKIYEIPIELPARTYGSSKMDLKEVYRSVKLLFTTFLTSLFNRDRYSLGKPLTQEEIDPAHYDPQGWDTYWEAQQTGLSFAYDTIAAIYRRFLIRPSLTWLIKKKFRPGAQLLHAGCGGGQVDFDVRKYANVAPLDISVKALNRYRQAHGDCKVLHQSIFNVSCANNTYDGVYNLGVMEHFTPDEIAKILMEFQRIVKPNGKIVLFWPPEFGLSVNVIKLMHFFLGSMLKKSDGKSDGKFHPDEITRITSKTQVEKFISEAGFELEEYHFGPRDLFTQCMIVARKIEVLTKTSAEAVRTAA